MKKELTIVVPNDYSAITLGKYLKMHKDLELYKDIEEAIDATLFYHLCNVEPETIRNIDTETYTKIKDRLYSFLGKSDFELQRFVTINGVEYGFEPNLSQMAYGAYVDISKFGDIKIDENWAKVMAILYRPVSKRVGKLYEIEPYTGNEDSTHWLSVNMEVNLGTMFFFINLSKDLLNATLKSLKEEENLPHIKSILAKSGEVINQL